MDYSVAPLPSGWRAAFTVPPSKSLHQRALALAALACAPVALQTIGPERAPGEDVASCARMMAALGTWQGDALGTSRESLTLDAGESGTAFRFAIALATLRPAGARTLVRGRPVLLRRPHTRLLRALRSLGASVKRRSSGAVRVLGGGLEAGRGLTLDGSQSSQYASALLLIAPRMGGLTLTVRHATTSRAYLDLTVGVLRRFDVGVEVVGDRFSVGAAAPSAVGFTIEPDASAAAAWWTAAALTGGEASVAGIQRGSRQPDTALWPILEAFGATLVAAEDGGLLVRGSAAGLRAPASPVNLRRTPDLIFLVGVLGACAEGETVIAGVGHARGKESDRVALLVRGLRALGVAATVGAEDSIRIVGAARPGGGLGLVGARLDCGGDHRAAIAFGVLGLAVPGIVLAGAEVAAKSQPGFLQDLAALAGEGLEGASRR